VGDLHGDTNVPQSVLDAIRLGLWDFEPGSGGSLPVRPTGAMPGTTEKLNVLAERLAMRGRGSDGRIVHRLHRKVDEAASVPDITIVNSGSAEYHARQLVRIIRGECPDE